MPEWNERPGFGEQQEEHAIDDRQRLFECGFRPGGASSLAPAVHEQRAQDVRRCVEYAVSQRLADTGGVAIGSRDERVKRRRVALIGREGVRAEDAPERGEGDWMID